MHDPKVVAINIPRPWPKRRRSLDSEGRFRFRYPWAKWWDIRPSRFMKFTVIFGRGFYWPNVITIWHNEPGGRDSGEVCKHHIRWQDSDGKWQSKSKRAWRWHVHHWSIQFHPWQHFRRWALTRCEWCGGPSRKGDVVNHSHQWDGERGPWWKGEAGLYHRDCSSVATAHRTCICGVGPWSSRDYGKCEACGCFRAWRKEPNPMRDDITRALRTIPEGARDRAAYDRAVSTLGRADVS